MTKKLVLSLLAAMAIGCSVASAAYWCDLHKVNHDGQQQYWCDKHKVTHNSNTSTFWCEEHKTHHSGYGCCHQ